MSELTYRAAVAAGLAQEMERDPSVVFLGEDVAAAGGVFKTTAGLLETFGPRRVLDTPISEQAILGMAMGAAMTGMRPVAEIMFSDFLAVCWDLVVNEIAKTRYMTDGQISLPLVIRTANGGGIRFGAQHSQSVENWAMAVPGLKVVAPSNAADMKGLLAAAIRDPDPVLVFEHKNLFASKGEVPDGEHVVPLGQAAVVREGDAATVVALAAMVPVALAAAETLAAEGIEVTVLDLRTLVPARHDHRPALRRGDRLAVHGRGEPTAVRLGRRGRVDRRRGGHRRPVRPDHPDHHATPATARRREPRAACHPNPFPRGGHDPPRPPLIASHHEEPDPDGC